METRLVPAALNTLASFNGSIGQPNSLVEDAHGNIFGTTTAAVLGGSGTVFELVNNNGNYALKTLYSFTGGLTSANQLILDAHEDLFGTTLNGGLNGASTVFELVNNSGSYTFQTLYSFPVGPGGTSNPAASGGLTVDGRGDLFGTDKGYTAGTPVDAVFELANNNGSYAFQTLHSFTFPTGSYGSLDMGLVQDAAGDLFGTSATEAFAGVLGYTFSSTVFELVNNNGSYTFQILDSSIAGAATSLTLGSDGNLIGTTGENGGANGAGSVFELVYNNGSYAFQTLYSFSGDSDGSEPNSVFMDAQGNLFGMPGVSAYLGYGSPAVFELVNNKGSYAYQTLDAFDFGSSLPVINFMDSNGNLFGITVGGTNGGGTVFELTTSGGTDGNPAANSANVNYVNNLYNVLFLRTPDAAGAAYWVSQLNSGTPQSTVIQDIEHSTEYFRDEVKGLYLDYLERNADPTGLAAWANLLASGDTTEQVTAGIVSSAEFATLHGSSNSAFVAALYQGVLGRAGSTDEGQAWVDALNGGATRSQVAAGFLNSTEHRADLVGSYYSAFLNRPADPNGQAAWVQALASGTSDQAVLADTLGSREAIPLWSS